MRNKGIRNPVQLARIRQLRADRDRLEAEWEAHRKICPRCGRVGLMAGKACDEGWEIGIRRARARNNWANRDQITAGNGVQGTLF